MIENRNIVEDISKSFFICNELDKFCSAEVQKKDQSVAEKLNSLVAIFWHELLPYRDVIDKMLREVDSADKVERMNSIAMAERLKKYFNEWVRRIAGDREFINKRVAEDLIKTKQYHSVSKNSSVAEYINGRVNAIKTLMFMEAGLCGLDINFYSPISFAFHMCIATLVEETAPYKSPSDLVKLFTEDEDWFDRSKVAAYFEYIANLRKLYIKSPELSQQELCEKLLI